MFGAMAVEPESKFDISDTPPWLDWAGNIASIIALAIALRHGTSKWSNKLKRPFSWLAGAVLCAFALGTLFVASVIGEFYTRLRENGDHSSRCVWRLIIVPYFIFMVHPAWNCLLRLPLCAFDLGILVPFPATEFRVCNYSLIKGLRDRKM